jgi:FkbM family methyltransferase
MLKKQKKLRLEESQKMAADKINLDVTSSFGSHIPKTTQRLVWKWSDWSVLPQSVRQRLRKRFARPVVGPFDIEHQGMKFRLYPAENYCDRVLFGRSVMPENAEHQALLPLLTPGMVFVDIGANVGSYSVFVGKHLQGEAKLVALEPHPRTFQKLLFNLKANNLPTSHVMNCGVGAAVDELDLWSDGGSNIGHTSMLKEGTANPQVSVRVQVRPLIDVLRQHEINSIDVLKIDIEGFEDRALAPFFDVAKEELLPKHILLETAHQKLWERNLLNMLSDRGYKTRFSTDENLLLSKTA